MKSTHFLDVLDYFFEYLNIIDKLSLLFSAALAIVITICISITSLPVIFLFAIGLILWLILFFPVRLALNRIYERMCSYEVDATVYNIYVDEFKRFGTNAYNINLCVDYEYNGKNYRRTVKFYHSIDLRSDSKIKLKICKFCPGIVWFEQNNK